ncbi:FUSC family protein [Chromobacterium alkanivorans]|uniref:FUSC family protein n=1 Tax=Chromobacterium alkanivorans TaxID=1071719 RepID=UPI001967580D|nr:FUSC family protein [Chromobacterium alkanivorans]MBN3002951.1 FUSC family protein [Chromobacterium alkanivorans]
MAAARLAGWRPLLSQALRGGFHDWLRLDGERWIFILKTLLAAFAALWLAFRLGFDSPGTALITVLIVSSPQSGLVLEKGFYRLLGTLAGSAAALVLVGMLASQPVLLLAALSLWVGLCAGYATLYRNSRSYGCVLAGYTACIIALPAIGQPLAVFDLAVTRVSEISLGLICSAVVYDIVFPRYQADQVISTVRGRYLRFTLLCQDALAQKLHARDLEQAQLKFAADIAALEAGRATAFFEAGHVRSRSNQLHAFNATFMAALTTFHTLHRQMERLRRDADSPLPGLLLPLFAEVAAMLSEADGPARTAAEAKGTVAQLGRLRAGWPRRVAAAREQLRQGEEAERWRIDFDTATELLTRFIEEMHAFAGVYHGFASKTPQQISALAAYTPGTPLPVAVAGGLRAALTLGALSVAWYWLAWPSALEAVLLATVLCCLAASSPRPVLMVKQFLTGFALGTPLAYACMFWVLSQTDGFPLLAAGMLPFLALGCYLKCLPKYAGVGAGMTIVLAHAISPQNHMNYDVVSFLNGSIARILGLALSAAFFQLVLPEHTMGSPRHIAAALWREARRACDAKLPHLKQRYENRIRDLLNQLNTLSPAQAELKQAITSQAITLLELGLAVINLRALTAESPSAQLRADLEHAVTQLARYFAAPSPERLQQAIATMRATGPTLRVHLALAEPERAARIQRALADLHLIHTSLLDVAEAAAQGTDHDS